jgi:hypothetical protein
MSALAPTVRVMQPHPWRWLRELSHVTLLWHDDSPGAPMGVANFAAQTVSIRRGMTYEQRRCTVLHELLHLDRGPALTTTVGRDEDAVRRATARLMLPSTRVLGDALAWAHDEHEAAEELSVDVGVLRDRLRWLHPSERHYLTRRLTDGVG